MLRRKPCAVVMVPSEVSVPGSLRTRLALHEPESATGIVPEEMVRGAIGVTMLVVSLGWRAWRT